MAGGRSKAVGAAAVVPGQQFVDLRGTAWGGARAIRPWLAEPEGRTGMIARHAHGAVCPQREARATTMILDGASQTLTLRDRARAAAMLRLPGLAPCRQPRDGPRTSFRPTDAQGALVDARVELRNWTNRSSRALCRRPRSATARPAMWCARRHPRCATSRRRVGRGGVACAAESRFAAGRNRGRDHAGHRRRSDGKSWGRNGGLASCKIRGVGERSPSTARAGERAR